MPVPARARRPTFRLPRPLAPNRADAPAAALPVVPPPQAPLVAVPPHRARAELDDLRSRDQPREVGLDEVAEPGLVSQPAYQYS